MSPTSEQGFSIFEAARESGAAVGLASESRVWTYNELADLTARACTWLRAEGALASRRPVAFTAHNDLVSLTTLFGLLAHGIPAFLLHPKHTEPEKSQQLAAGKGTTFEPLRLEPPATLLDTAAAVSPAAFVKTLPGSAGHPQDSDILAIVQTSGSSGRPRGVQLSRGALFASAQASAEHLGWQASDRWLVSIPLAHVGGLSIVCRSLAARRSLVLPSPGAFDAEALRRTITATQTTLLSLVPTQLERLYRACPGGCPPSLRAVLVGGARASTALVRDAKAAGWPLLTTYGATETCAQVVTQPYAARFTAESSIGVPLAGVELRVAQNGRLQIRSPTLFSGYFPGAPPSLTLDGYYETADLAQLSSAGELSILGRADDVIITGGENVLPQEVEDVLLTHPDVLAACVIGLPDSTWGERVCAGLVAAKPISSTELAQFCQQRLARFKVPKLFLCLPKLPELANHKPDRSALAARLALEEARGKPR